MMTEGLLAKLEVFAHHTGTIAVSIYNSIINIMIFIGSKQVQTANARRDCLITRHIKPYFIIPMK
ncbi:hypothetical protein CRM76_01095 [Edwardsiella tarda]|uniref:Uncharacterized protein n=1 Tax=Edwardsiella tarda TaxID=636 RepID=A0A2A7U7T1_EDWTA|nr:hypothetical protein CRM76_01095 [Edwardsiella tarda]